MALRLLLLVTLLLTAGPARAASIQSIEFSVISGGFGSSSGFALGPITGGTIRWVAAGGAVETPTNAPLGAFTQFSLTGPSGFFSFHAPVYGAGRSIASNSLFLTGFGGVRPSAIRSGPNATDALLFPISNYVAPFVCAGAAQTATFARCGTAFEGEARGSLGVLTDPTYGLYRNHWFGHSFTVGAEVVRTFVPEPSTGLLLGVALLAGAALARPGFGRVRGQRSSRLAR